MNLSCKCIANCGVACGTIVAPLPFWIVENDHGKFIINWTRANCHEVMSDNLSNMAKLKRTQLSTITASWLEPNQEVALRQVVSGKLGTIAQQINRIVRGTLHGQRILICLEDALNDADFYEALSINVEHPSQNEFSSMAEEGFEIEEPFCEIEMD